MVEKDIKARSYEFALKIIKFVRIMPRDIASAVLVKQLIRAGTSIGANIEEAQGASSKKDFINKMNIAKREVRETKYWLRLIMDSETLNNIQSRDLIKEVDELIKILTAISRTAIRNL